MDAIDPQAALAAAAARRGETLAALSRLLGKNAAYLQQYVKRGTPRVLPERDRQLLARYLGIDEAELGGPVRDAGRVRRIARIDVRAAAGAGGLMDDSPIGDLAIDARLIAALGVEAGDLSLIRAQGDSMEPTIHDGDQMLVDRADRQVMGRGGIYVIRHEDGLLVKRLRRIADGFEIVSDNPIHPPVSGRPEIVGRVVWLSRALK